MARKRKKSKRFKNLKETAQLCGFRTIGALSKALGVSHQYMGMIRRGERTGFKIKDTIERLIAENSKKEGAA